MVVNEPPPPPPHKRHRSSLLELPLCPVTDICRSFAKLALREVKADAWSARVPNHFRYWTEPIFRTVRLAGLARLVDVEETIERLLPTRYGFQEKLHNQVIRAMLRKILDTDYEATVMRVCEERAWDGPKQDMLALASRRSGKTVGFASIAATLLICVPSVQLVVISVSQRTASEMIIITRQFLQKDERGRRMLVHPFGAEQVLLRVHGSMDERRMRSFPGGGKAQDVSRYFSLSSFLFFFYLHARAPACTSTQ